MTRSPVLGLTEAPNSFTGKPLMRHSITGFGDPEALHGNLKTSPSGVATKLAVLDKKTGGVTTRTWVFLTLYGNTGCGVFKGGIQN